MCGNSIRSNRCNLEEWEILITYRENSFSMRVVKYWKRLCPGFSCNREVAELPSLEEVKTRRNVSLSSLRLVLSWELEGASSGHHIQPWLFHGYGDKLVDCGRVCPGVDISV